MQSHLHTRSLQNPEKPPTGSMLQVSNTLTVHGLPSLSLILLFNTLPLTRSSRSSESRILETKKRKTLLWPGLWANGGGRLRENDVCLFFSGDALKMKAFVEQKIIWPGATFWLRSRVLYHWLRPRTHCLMLLSRNRKVVWILYYSMGVTWWSWRQPNSMGA